MRKSRAVLGLFMAAAVGMTGCSASGEAGAGSTAQTPRQTSGQTAEQSEAASGEEISYEVTGPVEFEFWHSMETELIDPMCEAFNSSQDQITVTPVYVGNYAAIQEQIAAAQAAREGLPGLCTINYPFVNTYAESGWRSRWMLIWKPRNMKICFMKVLRIRSKLTDSSMRFPGALLQP